MTNEELTEKIKRLELERKYNELFSKTPGQVRYNNGKKFVFGILKKSGENIGTQLVTYIMGATVNKASGKNIVNPKKGQKDK